MWEPYYSSIWPYPRESSMWKRVISIDDPHHLYKGSCWTWFYLKILIASKFMLIINERQARRNKNGEVNSWGRKEWERLASYQILQIFTFFEGPTILNGVIFKLKTNQIALRQSRRILYIIWWVEYIATLWNMILFRTLIFPCDKTEAERLLLNSKTNSTKRMCAEKDHILNFKFRYFFYPQCMAIHIK